MQPNQPPHHNDEDETPDTTPRGSLWYWLFIAPGTLVLWVQYHWPSSGNAWASSRRYHANHPVIKVLYSLAVWGVVLIFIGVFWFAERRPA